MTTLATPLRIGLVCLAVLLTSCGSGSDEPTPSTPQKSATEQSNPLARSYENPDGGDAGHGDPKRATWKPLGNKTDRLGFDRRYVLATPNLSDEQLVTEARSMRGQYPKGWFWILDDESRWPAMWANLETPTDPDYPVDWVKAHTQANVALELDGKGGRTWVLYKGAGSEKIADLAPAKCGETVSSCT